MIRYTSGCGQLLNLHPEPPHLGKAPHAEGTLTHTQGATQRQAESQEHSNPLYGYPNTEAEHGPAQPAHGPAQPAYRPVQASDAPDKAQDTEDTQGHTRAPGASAKDSGEAADKPADRPAAAHLYACIPAGEKVCTELYLGKTKNICASDGIYDNTDKSLIPLGSNPRLAGLMCGTGYAHSQEDLVEMGYFQEEDFTEYDNLRYTSLKGLKREQEPRFCLTDEERPEGYPMQVPPRTDGTEADILQEAYARGYALYLDYIYLRDHSPRYILALRLGPGYIVIGNTAHNFAALTGRRDEIITYHCVQKRIGLCAILQEDLYARLPAIRQKYGVCISPDGQSLHMYPRMFAKYKSFRCVNETKKEYNRR
ncbi:MAG: hypothetical protein LUD50_01260 [Clostridia bacterium]|nr:hypothetical protein [Clostridia bacterium]